MLNCEQTGDISDGQATSGVKNQTETNWRSCFDSDQDGRRGKPKEENQEGEVMPRKQIIHDRDIDIENDCVLAKMLSAGAPLTLEKYLEFAFLGNPPEGIEEDGEFLASVPDVILANSKRVQ